MDKEYLLDMGLSEESADHILQTHAAEIRDMEFRAQFREAVHAAGGRSVRAIGAMLDLETIKADGETDKALKAALQQLKSEHGYLFENAPPPYAPDTGTRKGPAIEKPATLAGAIRQKYERK